MAQPRNVFFGHVVSAVIGVFFQQTVGSMPWLAAALAVSVSVGIMELLGRCIIVYTSPIYRLLAWQFIMFIYIPITGIVHPPGGATAVLAVIGSDRLKALGYLFVLIPVMAGAVMMLLVGLLIMNLYQRSYPKYWV